MWYKAKDKEPPDQDGEYFLRNIGDKYTGWWDNEEKEFYMIGRDSGIDYFTKEEFPNIEWWNEVEEANQDILWDEALIQLAVVNEYSDIKTAKEDLISRYTLSRK